MPTSTAPKRPIYLDYMATTPVDPRVAECMSQCLTLDGVFGNASSQSHIYGVEAAQAIAKARAQVAALVNADPNEIVWTSGATEANNLAIQGAAHFYQRNGRHLITCETEHKAVLDPCRQLASDGFEVTFLKPQANGLINLNDFKNALRPDTILVSLMQANNEIGVIQDIAALGALCRAQGTLFHVDAAQSAGKMPIDLKSLPVDLMSFSSHKVYGPKGVGALYVRRQPRVRLRPLAYGGGHENGLRPGTLPTHLIVGMGEAFTIAKAGMAEESARVLGLRNRLLSGLSALDEMYVNGDLTQRLPGNLNVSFGGVDGDALILALKDIAISTTSACTSASVEPSYVLRALGVPSDLAHSAIRLSIGRYTTEADIDVAIACIREQVKRLREMAP